MSMLEKMNYATTPFSSQRVRPQYDPENLPPSVICVNAFDEETIQRTIEDLESEAQTNLREIVDAFIDDSHSKGIALTVLEYRHRQIKTLFFQKVVQSALDHASFT